MQALLTRVGLKPKGVQIDAIENGLLEGTSIMVSSPTGSGKTLIGEMALLRAVFEGRKGLYIVPLRALARQVATTLRGRYQNLTGLSVGLSTGDYQHVGDELSENDIIVTTYERADSLLRHRTGWINDIGTLVIDEIQNLGDLNRGPRLETVIMRMRRSIPENLQIIALSATVGAPDELAEWLGCRLVESNERPVPLQCAVLETDDRRETIKRVVMSTVRSNGQVLVFLRTRASTESIAERLAPSVTRQLTSRERDAIVSERQSIEHYGTTVPLTLQTLLESGVAYHHAGLDAPTRRLVETMFQKGMVRLVCSTTTLGSGMDLPARTVIVSSVRSPGNHTDYIDTNRLHQMLGRAGRPGKDAKGFGVVITESRGEAEMVKSRYFLEGAGSLEPKFLRIDSSLNNSAALTEQLLVAVDFLGGANLETIEHDYFADSYLQFVAVRDTMAPMRSFIFEEVSADAAIEKHALSGTVRAARQNVLGTVDLREISDSVVGALISDGGTNASCRFSIRRDQSGMSEGAMCSCGRPLGESGVLCPHLVNLGVYAARTHQEIADYVIPLSLSESSPVRMLVRMGLVEGGRDGLRATHLGKIVSRLYLSPGTVREMLPLLPLTESSIDLLDLLKIAVRCEGGQAGIDLEFIVGTIVSTSMSVEEIAERCDLNIGDIHALLDLTIWLLYGIAAIAEAGNMKRVAEMAWDVYRRIEERRGGKYDGSDREESDRGND